MPSQVNKENSIVTIVIDVSYEEGTEVIKKFIREEQIPFIDELNLSKIKRFEWFLDEDDKKGTLIEVFDDGDGFAEAAGKVMGTPLNLKFQALFNIHQMTVLGTVNEELKEKLKPLGTNVRGYTGGFSIA